MKKLNTLTLMATTVGADTFLETTFCCCLASWLRQQVCIKLRLIQQTVVYLCWQYTNCCLIPLPHLARDDVSW